MNTTAASGKQPSNIMNIARYGTKIKNPYVWTHISNTDQEAR
jgi:hypothetical protein